jgi:hypothetical protein
MILTKRLINVGREISLSVLAYNLLRVIKIPRRPQDDQGPRLRAF